MSEQGGGSHALSEIVDTVLTGVSEDDDDTQLKLLNIIMKHGIQSRHKPSSIEQSEWLMKCLAAIEMICDKKPLLLNHQSEESNTAIFKWIISSLIPLLGSTDETLLNSVKRTVTTIIHLISAKLRIFSYKKEIRTYFITTFDTYITNLFKTTNSDKLHSLLLITINLFSLLTDTEVRKKLMIDRSLDQKFESSIRKIDLVISSIIRPSSREKMDVMKSNMVIGILYYSINGEYLHHTRLKFLINHLHELLCSSSITQFPSTQITIGYSLLLLLKKCIAFDIIDQFQNLFQLNIVIEATEKISISPTLSKALMFIKAIATGSHDDPHIHSPFQDTGYETLRLEIIGLALKESDDGAIVKSLPFQTAADSIELWYKESKKILELSSNVSNSDLFLIINSIGQLICYSSDEFESKKGLCPLCSHSNPESSDVKPNREALNQSSEFLNLLNLAMKRSAVLTPKDVIIHMAYLTTIHKYFSHYQPPKISSNCLIYQYLQKQLVSTNREVRLLTARIFPLYALSNDDINDYNLDAIFNFLDSINVKQKQFLIEAVVIIWGQLALVSNGDTLQAILYKLINYLSSSNSYESTIAFHELKMVAIGKSKTPWQLLSNLLPDLSITIALKWKSNPLMGQRITDLVGVPLTTILNRTSSYTVPHLITSYKSDIVGEIAKASEMPKLNLVLENRAKICAVLVTTVPDLTDSKLHTIMTNACPEFKQIALTDIFNTSHCVWEVLKLYSPEAKNKDVLLKAIKFILKISETSNPTMNSFFQTSILAVVQNFFDTIRDRKGQKPSIEKLSSIRAVELLAEISGSSIVSALPQIYTCLLAALDDVNLREATLRCWKTVVIHLEEPHLVTLLDQSISIVVQRWESFDSKSRREAEKIITALFDKSDAFRSKHIYSFYSLAENDELVEIYRKVHNAIQKNDKPIALLNDIIRRCKNDNKHVVKQALVDLSRFLKQYQNIFFSTFLQKPSFTSTISSLLSSLFDILFKFKYSDDISIQCSRCLGMIGALDPTKFEFEKKKEHPVIASDFEDHREKLGFMLKFLNQFVVPAFWSSDHPNKQLFLAYSMQEILKLCGLDSSKADIEKLSPGTTEFALWSQFTDIAKSTLTPLVSSRYTASVGTYDPLHYPIFSASKDHNKWLRLFTLDLLKSGKEGEAGAIFEICQSLIKDQDVSFTSFLLPYAALHIIISGDDKHVENIRTEIMTVLSVDIDEVHHLATDNLRLAYESIFNLLDYLRKWIFARKQHLKRKNIKKSDSSIAKVNDLLFSIPQQLMAKRSFQANSFERSVLYLEQCFRSNTIQSFGSNFVGTLQSMYANIRDFDALDGSLKKFSTESLDDRITQLEFSDHWEMAHECFEALSNTSTKQESSRTDTRLLKSLYDHELYDKVLTKLDLVTDGYDIPKDWLNLALDSSILSGNLVKLQHWVGKLEMNENFSDGQNIINYHTAKMFLAAESGDKENFEKHSNNVLLMIGSCLGLSKLHSLNKNHPSLVLLHSLSDFESIFANSKNFNSLKSLMNTRLNNAGNDFKSHWIISSYRKTGDILSGTKENTEDVTDIWVDLSKVARKHNRLDLATSSIMFATGLQNTSIDMEYAEILWAQNDRPGALKVVDQLRKSQKLGDASPRQKASVQLKYTKWLDESNNRGSSEIIEEYSAAIRLDSSWEESYYHLGKYYNKILDLKSLRGVDETANRANIKEIGGEYERRVISFYLKTIHNGTTYLYEALPKLITVWLDFANDANTVPNELSESVKIALLKERKKSLTAILEEITKYSQRIPRYFWYTVFSQLLSRLDHSEKSTNQLIVMICHLVVQDYPSHALWSVLAQFKSKNKERSEKAKQILELFSSSDSRDTSKSNSTILKSSRDLFNQLIFVSKKALGKVKGPLLLGQDFNFDHSVTPSPLVVPVKTNFNITLPTTVQTMRNHNAFPNSSNVTIAKFENKVDILSSMQQPRHLYLRGSNGLNYGILCKPNDDLRKDAKLMEFTTMVDHLLKKDYESEQRSLHITTYAVIPLNESYGIIEWVEHSRTMRDILKVHYASMNITLDFAVAKRILEKDHELSEKAELFKNELLPSYPPVLYQWFIENFPDPTSWYDARNNYTRTTAVMSMVGYMLGLGDRHGENLLFNEKDGGILHVDFDCLFEKGLELAVPERVPFRLTPNMVDAFGITGVEGTFRKSCEVTLNLLRTNETPLMNILESFLHDPIMDWASKKRSRSTPQSALSTIRRKIRGILDKEGLPMSVQGQADFLIQQATSIENLCQMYIGWMAFW